MDLSGSEHGGIRALPKRLRTLRSSLGPRLSAAAAGASGRANATLDSAKLLSSVAEQALSGILSLINDISQETVWPERTFKKYRRRGYSTVVSCEDIGLLDVSVIDGAVSGLEARYAAVAAVEGGLTGGLSVLGPGALAACISADVVALIGLNLRAVGDYATHYGFDIGQPQERLYALHVLMLASSWSDASKELVLAELYAIAKQAAAKKTWAELEKHLAVKAAQQIAERLSIRLTKTMLARAVPFAGIVIGSGFNAFYTRKVCQEAPKLYRERFLLAQNGLASGS